MFKKIILTLTLIVMSSFSASASKVFLKRLKDPKIKLVHPVRPNPKIRAVVTLPSSKNKILAEIRQTHKIWMKKNGYK